MTEGDLIKKYRQERGLSLRALSKRLNMSPSTISRIERGETLADWHQLMSFCKALDIDEKVMTQISVNNRFSPDFIVTDNESSTIRPINVSEYILETLENMNILSDDGQKQVLDYSSLLIDSGKYDRLEDPETQYTYIDTKYAAAAGHGYLNDEYATATRHKVKVQDTPNYDEAIEVRGDSMSPLIADGDLAYVQYDYEYKDGKIYAVQVEDETLIKYCYLEDDTLTLVSENPNYKDRIVKLCEDSPVRIIGIVAGWVTPEG